MVSHDHNAREAAEELDAGGLAHEAAVTRRTLMTHAVGKIALAATAASAVATSAGVVPAAAWSFNPGSYVTPIAYRCYA